MITCDYVTQMARYNSWQSDHLVTVADSLDEAARLMDRGAFFSSIFGTFNHLLWGDKAWLSRFSDAPGPNQTVISQTDQEEPDWAAFKTARSRQNQLIEAWAGQVAQAELDDELSWYSAAVERQMTKPMAICVVHFFNHQTHHRGQIHAMLTAAGAKTGDTDLILMPDA